MGKKEESRMTREPSRSVLGLRNWSLSSVEMKKSSG